MLQNKEYDILLKNGHVIDPANQIDSRMDIAVKNGKICKAEADIREKNVKKVLDVKGCYVVPGLIDMHCHCYPLFPLYKDSLPTINPDAHMFQAGVTTAVDAGTCGWKDFYRFKEEIIDKAETRILAFLNIASGGMVHLDTEQEPKNFHPQIAASMAKEFDDVVVGFKSAHYWVGIPFDEVHTPWASIDCMTEAGELCNKPCMADFQPNLPLRTYQELILEHLRPGDIHTHVFAQQFPILDENGEVEDYMYRARERGVLFDLGHGAFSFWFRNAVPALRQGFYPDTISTDLYVDNVAGPVISMTHVMSKYLNMGMPLREVIYRSTVRPAQVVRHPELGTLSVGSCADVAILRDLEGPVAFADSGRTRINGNHRLECVGTIRNGKIVYNPYAMGMPEWENAPAPYWTTPGVLDLD
ncbi:MAG: amidohydrolase/deacetylase family metallohydrolase [Eubacteriales bacterium]|nr:amidohydrolase/deacetylase family metallohydrolase [Eubacteriales bacterium]